MTLPDQLHAWCPWCEAVTPQYVCPPAYQPADLAARRYWCEPCLGYVLHPLDLLGRGQ